MKNKVNFKMIYIILRPDCSQLLPCIGIAEQGHRLDTETRPKSRR